MKNIRESNTAHMNLPEWSQEMNGARKMILRLRDEGILLVTRGNDKKIYSDAIYRLILSNKDNTFYYLSFGKIGFRNHKKNAEGKLISCEAYFK